MKELYLKVLNSEISLEEFEAIIKAMTDKSKEIGYDRGYFAGHKAGYDFAALFLKIFMNR